MSANITSAKNIKQYFFVEKASLFQIVFSFIVVSFIVATQTEKKEEKLQM